jgi:hypothetical protein
MGEKFHCHVCNSPPAGTLSCDSWIRPASSPGFLMMNYNTSFHMRIRFPSGRVPFRVTNWNFAFISHLSSVCHTSRLSHPLWFGWKVQVTERCGVQCLSEIWFSQWLLQKQIASCRPLWDSSLFEFRYRRRENSDIPAYECKRPLSFLFHVSCRNRLVYRFSVCVFYVLFNLTMMFQLQRLLTVDWNINAANDE